MSNLISIPIVFAVGDEGGVWPVLEEFGCLLARSVLYANCLVSILFVENFAMSVK